MKFRSLASSSGGCCYHVSGNHGKGLLIDAGLSFSEIQKGLRFRVSGLAGVLISHGHQDHCKAVPQLIKLGIDCYASPETWEHLTISGHRAKTISAGDTVMIDGWKVFAISAVHDLPGTLGFVVTSPDDKETLLYLTDSAYSAFAFKGLTHIAIECNHSMELLKQNALSGDLDVQRFKRVAHTHMSLERLITLLKASDLSDVVEIHLLHLSDQNSDAAAFKTAIQQATGKPTFVADK